MGKSAGVHWCVDSFYSHISLITVGVFFPHNDCLDLAALSCCFKTCCLLGVKMLMREKKNRLQNFFSQKKKKKEKKNLGAASSEDVCVLHNKAFRVYHFTNTSKAKSCRKLAMKTLWLQQVSPGGGRGAGMTTPAAPELWQKKKSWFLELPIKRVSTHVYCVFVYTGFLPGCHLGSISQNIVTFCVSFHTNECKFSYILN